MPRPKVGLFVTCLVDLLRPSVGEASLKLIEDSGCDVVVPRAQTCCGQPAHNSGAPESARALARQTIEAFDSCDYVVAPSGSCAGMLRIHYPALFAGDANWEKRSRDFAARCHELVSFLVNIRGVKSIAAKLAASVAYHDSCSGLRELNIRAEPRRLLSSIEGLRICEIADGETCCGFGGAFCVKYPEISARIGGDKLENVSRTGAEVLLSGDLGCLLHLAGLASRKGSAIAFRHVAEVLAGDLETPAIGEPQR